MKSDRSTWKGPTTKLSSAQAERPGSRFVTSTAAGLKVIEEGTGEKVGPLGTKPKK